MAYNQQQGGYGQYNPYGQSGNPYSQQPQSNPYDQPYGHTGNYSERPDLEHHSSSRYTEENAQGGSYEMSSMNSSDPNRILNEVRNMDRAIDDAEERLKRLEETYKRYLEEIDTRRRDDLRDEFTKLSDDLRATYDALVKRSAIIKSDRESGSPRNQAQVGKVDRRIKATMHSYQMVERKFEQQSKEQMRRDYRTVRPDASEAEINEAVESNNDQIFSQHMMAVDRQGKVQTTSRNVQQRHSDVKKIEKDMVELAQLFIDLETSVVQQEPAVTQIEEKGEQATRHVAQANTELDGAVKKAKSARRKKLMCLGIALLIVIIIVVVVVVVVEVTKH